MRHTVVKVVITILAAWTVMITGAKNIYAEEKELKVDITTEKDEKILVKKDEILYTSQPLRFICDEFPDGTPGDGDYYYCVSLDQGMSFGGYVQMDGNDIVLYPDDMRGNDYVLRFKYEKKNADSDYEENETEVIIDEMESEQIPEDDSICYISCDYRVQFDTCVPQIYLLNPEIIDNWISSPQEMYLRIKDEIGIISKIIVLSEDELIYEKHFSGNDRVQEYDFNLWLNEEMQGSQGKMIDIKVCDMAGNTMSSTYTYYLDCTQPVLTVEGVENGAVYGSSTELTIHVTDNCDDILQVRYSIEKQIGEEIIVDDMEELVRNGEAIAKTFDSEGHYTIYARCTDRAGNVSEEICINFAIDLLPPQVEIIGITNNLDIKTPCEVQIEVKEEFYENCNVSVTVIRTKNDEKTNIPVSSINMEAITETRSIQVKNDGDYEIYVTATDGLGRQNSASTYFRIDKNSPQLSIEGLNDGQITNEKPVINISSAECFYESTVIDAVLMKKISEDCYIEALSDKYVMSNKVDTHEMQIDKEGEYELICKATDRTGNSVNKKIKFTVDYTPPVLATLDDVDGKFFKSFTLPQKVFSVAEDMTNCTVNAFINNDKVKGDEIIVEEGKYVLWINGIDEADNYTEEEATFIVDHTAPQLVITGMDSSGTIKKGNLLTVSLANTEDELAQVKLNGKNISLSDDKKSAQIQIEDYGDYSIEIDAFDLAGNETSKTIYTNCVMLSGPVKDYLYSEKIIKNIGEKIVDNDKKSTDAVGMIIGCFIVLVGIGGLVIREIIRAARPV